MTALVGAAAPVPTLEEVADARGAGRRELVEAFLRGRWTQFGQIARWLCRNFGVDPAVYAEDFHSMVSIEAYAMLIEQLDPEDARERVVSFDGLLRVRARAAVRSWLDTEAAPASHMSTALRRRRMLGAVRDELRAARNEEPADSEVVREHNRRMAETRSDPARQGVLATVADLAVTRRTEELPEREPPCPEPDWTLHPAEGPAIVRRIIARAHEHGPALGHTAELWLSPLYSSTGPGEPLEVPVIAAALGLSRTAARARLARLRTLAAEVAAHEFGITGTR
ncbi:hypothetical protein [Sinomonas halotolerans]|uniref:Uncharacterized protein n=1 Tax=Sinomonas halotolerans TaxID=1644133 RepID=A0ABU9X2H4_9MICC